MTGEGEGGGFHPFQVNVIHLCYTFLGGFVVLFGMFSLLIKERLYIGEAVIATVIGIAIGPHGANLFSPINWGGAAVETTNEITLEVTRVVIAIGVFAVGVELPKAYMKKKWKSLAFLLGPVMVFGWLVSSLLIWGLFPDLDFLCALVIAACVTPTDPILAQAVVGGKFADKHVPAHIRHLLSAESGSNDGAAFPFLYLALYLILDASDSHAVGEWFYVTWLYEVLLGTILGALLGFCARKTMKFSERHGLIDRQSFVAQYVSLAVFSIGMTTLLGSDDLLAAFACGTAFAWDGFFNRATEDSYFSNVIDLLFNCACFIYIGAIIPFSSFVDSQISLSIWRLILLSLSILFLRRLPVILALYRWIPDIRTFREALFVGWFGPMGVGAIFISTLARTKLPSPHYPPENQVEYLTWTIQPIVAFLVLTSVMFHGLSIPFFSLGRRVHSIHRTRSRSSIDMRDEPAWSTHSRRIIRGADIRINRDDDVEGGEPAPGQDPTAEKLGDVEKAGSSRTPSGSGESSTQVEMEMAEVQGGRRSEVDALERGEHVGESDITEERRDSHMDGTATPPRAEYREGNHLIVERKKGDGEEVTVEVKRNFFSEDEETEEKSFDHPGPLKHGELDKLWNKIETSVSHAVSSVRGGGIEEIDQLGLGLMDGNSAREADEEEHQKTLDAQKREDGLREGRRRRGERDPEEAEEDDEEDRAEEQSQDKESSTRAMLRGKGREQPTIIEEPEEMNTAEASGSSTRHSSEERRSAPRRMTKTSQIKQAMHSRRPVGTRKESVRRMLFGKKPASGKPTGILVSGPMDPRPMDGSDHSDDEEPRGRVVSNPSPAPSTSQPNSRPPSPPRLAPAIRFTEDTAPSSSTVPSGLRGYGHKPSGSGLDMYRSSSIHSIASQKSDKGSRPPSPTRAPAIRFTSGTAESSATVPSGLRGYGHKPANPTLSIHRTQSVQSQSSQRKQ